MWTVLAIIAVVALVLYWGDRQGRVRESLTVGVAGGVIAATVYFFIGYDFLWSIVGKWTVAIVVLAFVQEVLRWIRKQLLR